MASEVDICNQALQAIGTRTSMTSLDEDSPEARQCQLVYSSCRDQLLRAAHWDFAKKTDIAGLLKSAPDTPEFQGEVSQGGWSHKYPPPGWLYEYAMPADCLFIRHVVPNTFTQGFSVPLFSGGISANSSPITGSVKFEKATDEINGVDTTVILTNQPQALLIYTKRVTVVNLFDPLFFDALVSAVAANIAIPLTGDKTLASMKSKEANEAILAARIADGNEGPTIYDPDPSWLAARTGYSQRFAATAQLQYGPLFPVI